MKTYPRQECLSLGFFIYKMKMAVLQLLGDPQIRIYVIVECSTWIVCALFGLSASHIQEHAEIREKHVPAFVLDAKGLLRATLGAVFRDKSSCITRLIAF